MQRRLFLQSVGTVATAISIPAIAQRLIHPARDLELEIPLSAWREIYVEATLITIDGPRDVKFRVAGVRRSADGDINIPPQLLYRANFLQRFHHSFDKAFNSVWTPEILKDRWTTPYNSRSPISIQETRSLPLYMSGDDFLLNNGFERRPFVNVNGWTDHGI